MSVPASRGRVMEFAFTLDISKTVAPRIAGMASKNEKFADLVLPNPKNVPVLIVVPDLETPGNIAIACPIPIKIASQNRILLFFFFIKPDIKRIIPVNMRHIPIINGESNMPSI